MGGGSLLVRQWGFDIVDMIRTISGMSTYIFYVDSEILALDHIRNLRESLDVSQRARFDRMITDQLAGPCGMCTHCGAGCKQPQGARQ
jgi:hypothetical protein